MKPSLVIGFLILITSTVFAQATWQAVFQTQDGIFTESCSGGLALDNHRIAYLYIDYDEDGPDTTDEPPRCVWIPGMVCIPEETGYNYRNFTLAADGTINSALFQGWENVNPPHGPLHLYLRIFFGTNNDSCFTSPVAIIPDDRTTHVAVMPRAEWTCSLADVEPPECMGSAVLVSLRPGTLTEQCLTVCPGGGVGIMVDNYPDMFHPPLIRLSSGCDAVCEPTRSIHFSAGAWTSQFPDLDLWFGTFTARDAGCVTVSLLDTIPCARLDTMTAARSGHVAELRWNTTREYSLDSFQIWNEVSPHGYSQRLVSTLAATGNPNGSHYFLRDDSASHFAGNTAYTLVMVAADGQEYAAAYVSQFGVLSADDQFNLHPSDFVLSSFPNPFNPTTTLTFTLPRARRITISVYDLLGRKAADLADGVYEAGEHHVEFNASSLPSGLYFARMQNGNFAVTQKLLMLK